MKLYCEFIVDENFNEFFMSQNLMSREGVLLNLKEYYRFLCESYPECEPTVLSVPLSHPMKPNALFFYSSLINGHKYYRGFIEFNVL